MNKILSKEVSFELAKLLKEKGFDELTNIWRQHGDGISGDVEGKKDYYNRKGSIYTSLPTIAEVLDWIYNKTGDWFSIDSENNKTYYYYVPKEGEINFSKEYPTILEAYENAIKYSLNKML